MSNKEIENIKKLITNGSLLDVAIAIESFLDDMNIYVYKNWFDGVIWNGPILKRYMVEISLKYPYKKMPDPTALKILQKLGVMWDMHEHIERVPVVIKSPNDYRDGTKKAKIVDNPVWIVTLNIPRRFIDESELNDLGIFDEINLEDIEDAYDDGIDKDALGHGFKGNN